MNSKQIAKELKKANRIMDREWARIGTPKFNPVAWEKAKSTAIAIERGGFKAD